MIFWQNMANTFAMFRYSIISLKTDSPDRKENLKHFFKKKKEQSDRTNGIP